MTARAALEVRDLGVRFGGVSALQGVSFAVSRGSVTSLIGPNGAGKTTAFNVITGFQRPSSGEVRYTVDNRIAWPASNQYCIRRSAQKLK